MSVRVESGPREIVLMALLYFAIPGCIIGCAICIQIFSFNNVPGLTFNTEMGSYERI